MSEENEIIENEINEEIAAENKEEKKVNLWKVLFISIFSIILIIGLCVGVYNSDWYINKTMAIKEAKDLKLGKNIKWSYENKYENGELKIFLTIKNIDKNLMDSIIYNYFSNDEYVIKLEFQDKDGYNIKTLEIPLGDFVNNEDKNEYTIQGRIDMDKKIVRKIKTINPIYRALLDQKYDDIIQEMQEAFDNLFNY